MINRMRNALRSVMHSHPEWSLPVRRVYCMLGFGTRLEEDFLFTLARRRKDVFFLQIGANDGATRDHLYYFVKRYDWHGIALEPLPDVFERLQANYHAQRGVIPLCAAMGSGQENLTFYRVKPGSGVPDTCDRLGSFLRETIASHRRIYPDIEQHIITQDVRVISFDNLVKEFDVRRIDVLMIDAEGYDYEILTQIDFERFHPALVIYEQIHLDAQTKLLARNLLERAGYDVHPVLNMNCVGVLSKRFWRGETQAEVGNRSILKAR